MMTNDTRFEKQLLSAFGAQADHPPELVEYVQNPMSLSSLPADLSLPLPDEPFVSAWKSYVAEAEQIGAAQTLKKRFLQLRFPIQEGISTTQEYQDAVKKGILPDWLDSQQGVLFKDPGGIRLVLHSSPAGRLGVIVTQAREDFVSLVQALTAKNEPVPVPDSLGAYMVGGFNNWDRIWSHCRTRLEERGEPKSEQAWQKEFRELIPHKELYKDRFIILSSGPYSNVRAEDLGLDQDTWTQHSGLLRMEHECTHYFTRRVFSSMQSNIWDEILADYMGIRAAFGEFKAQYLLRFLGLENYPHYRPGGRLENYIPEPLKMQYFDIMKDMTFFAAGHLQELDHELGVNSRSPEEQSGILLSLCAMGLPALCSSQYREIFSDSYNNINQNVMLKEPEKHAHS